MCVYVCVYVCMCVCVCGRDKMNIRYRQWPSYMGLVSCEAIDVSELVEDCIATNHHCQHDYHNGHP